MNEEAGEADSFCCHQVFGRLENVSLILDVSVAGVIHEAGEAAGFLAAGRQELQHSHDAY